MTERKEKDNGGLASCATILDAGLADGVADEISAAAVRVRKVELKGLGDICTWNTSDSCTGTLELSCGATDSRTY